MRDIRIKEYFFQSGTSNLLTTSAGSINIWTDHPINGTIKRVVIKYADTTTTGSVCIRESGTDVEIIRKNGLAATLDAYPAVRRCGSESSLFNLVSGNTLVEQVTTMPLKFEANGCGTDKVISGVYLYYI